MKKFSQFINLKLSHYETILIVARGLILLLAGLTFSSCSEYLNGKPFKTAYLEIKSDGKMACLDNVSSDMEKFLNSEGSDAEIDKTVDCIDGILTEFQTKVEGTQDANSFTADDVYNILAKFASRLKVSEIAAKNLIALKAAMLGGDAKKITKTEIELLKKYLTIVKAEAKSLKPYIKVFYFKKSEKAYTKAFIKESFDQLNTSLRNLYKGSQLNVSNYSFDSFAEFITNVLNMSDENKARVNIVSKLSKMISGGPAELSEADRFKYIDNVTELMRLYAHYVNGYAKFEITTSADLNESIDFFESGLDLLENTVQFKNTKIISVQTLYGLVSSIVNSKLLSFKLSTYDAAVFYRTLFVRVFESGLSGKILSFAGIKAINLRNIRREVAIYKVYSKMLERIASEELFLARGITHAPISDLQQSFRLLNVADETEILSKYDLIMQNEIINNVTDLKSEFTGLAPIIYKNNKIGLASNQNLWEQKWKDLARGLIIKMMGRLLMQGWGKIYPLENLATNSMSELNLTDWYSEFKHFGIAIKNFDPRKYNSGSAAFNTANLFTRAANGDTEVTFKELIENLGVVYSSGIIYDETDVKLNESNCNMPELDVFDNHWRYETCFLQILRANYKFNFSGLPHLVAYLDTLSEQDFNSFFFTAINVVRLDDNNKGVRVETSDMSSMYALLNFIENLYKSHDSDANGRISEPEIRAAYPKFLNTATKFAYQNSRQQIEDFESWMGGLAGYGCFSKDDLIRESFVFLIYNGRAPIPSDMNKIPCYTDRPLLDFNGEIDRMKMLNSFKGLKKAVGL